MLNFVHSHTNIQHCFFKLKRNLQTMLFRLVWREPHCAMACRATPLNYYNFYGVLKFSINFNPEFQEMYLYYSQAWPIILMFSLKFFNK